MLRLIAVWERVCELGLGARLYARTCICWGMLRMGIVISVLIILLGAATAGCQPPPVLWHVVGGGQLRPWLS